MDPVDQNVPTPTAVGVVGTGTIARAVHLPLLARHPGVRVVAVSDLDAARAAAVAASYGARPCTTADLLDAPDVDAVLVATPGDHATIAAEALRRGKHVLAEKPLALTQEDALRLAALAEERGLVLQVGYMKAHDAAVEPLRAALAQVGDVRLVQVRVRHASDAPQLAHLRPAAAPPAPLGAAELELVRAADEVDAAAVVRAVGDLPPAWQRLYRSVLCGSVLHELSLLRAAGLGLPRVEHAALSAWEGGQPPVLTVSGVLPGGARMELAWLWLPDFPEYQEVLEVSGTAGSVRLDVAAPYALDAPSSLEVLTAGAGAATGPGGRPEHRRAVLGRDGAFQRQLEAFVAAVRQGAPTTTGAGSASAAGAAEDVRWLQQLTAHLAADAGLRVGGEAAGL